MGSTSCWHSRLPTALGELTLVRDEEAVLGVYYRNHWGWPDPSAFGPRRVVGAAGKLTGSAGGLARKRLLLDLEQTGLAPGETIPG